MYVCMLLYNAVLGKASISNKCRFTSAMPVLIMRCVGLLQSLQH